MQKTQTLSIVRHALTFIGGLLVARGTFDEASANELVGGIMAIAGALWGVVDKKP